MALWYKVAWIPPLFDALNKVFPNRSKASDGTKGDEAHQDSPSGHNPDDTPGSKPEREDADSKPEVRAADITTTLRSEITMEMVIQRILATPVDRDRLIYIIYNRRIWRKSNAWRQEAYTGSDPHDTHAHLSGDPNYDEDSRPWSSILSFVEEDMNVEQDTLLKGAAWRVHTIINDLPEVPDNASGGVAGQPNVVHERLNAMDSKLDALAIGGVTHEQLVTAMVAAMESPAGKAAIVAAVNQAEDS